MTRRKKQTRRKKAPNPNPPVAVGKTNDLGRKAKLEIYGQMMLQWPQMWVTLNLQEYRQAMRVSPFIQGPCHQLLPMASLGRRPATSLGTLEVLPTELMAAILHECTSPTLVQLSRVNKAMYRIVRGLPYYAFVTLAARFYSAELGDGSGGRCQVSKYEVPILDKLTFNDLLDIFMTNVCEKCGGGHFKFGCLMMRTVYWGPLHPSLSRELLDPCKGRVGDN